MKKWKLSFLCLMLIFLMGGCTSKPQETVTEDGEEKSGIEIGMSFDSYVIERWQKDRDVFVSAAKEQGAYVNVQNANGDVDTQISQIRYLISKKVDVIVIICIDSESLSEVIDEAKSEGIKVISYDRLIKNANTDLYISFDNEMVGSLMGTAMAESGLTKKKVLMLTGPTTDNNVSMLDEGFEKAMKQKGITVVDIAHVDGWKAELAADYIYEHPAVLDEIDGIMCGNDNIATTVIRTLAEKRLAGKIKIVGQDADLEACQRIVEGTQVMTVYKPVEKLAQTAAQYAVQLAKGEDLSDVGKTINDGTYDIPYVVLEPIAVNRNNMEDTVIKSGFHLKEDVYLNVRSPKGIE